MLYLHGFASGPSSRKATFFREEFYKNGLQLEIPDLAAGDFRNLTISGQLGVIERLLHGDRAVLIGSSLGGYLAALYASRHPEVQALALLAPAFNLHQRWADELGEERLKHWQETGEMAVYHYGERREMPLGFKFLAEARQFAPFPNFSQTCVICHGTEDRVVPVEYSEAFARNRPNVRLVRLQSGHELTDVLGIIWEETGPVLLGTVGH
jgi:hypothetical protein